MLFGADPTVARTFTALRVTSAGAAAGAGRGHRRGCCWTSAHPPSPRHLDLECGSSSPQRARLFIESACADWQLDLIRDPARVVASELVANAVQHRGHGLPVVTLRHRARGLTIAVYDHAPDLALPLRPVAESQRGRGLFIVAALSLHRGLSRGRNEKCVWAYLPISAWATYSYTVRTAARDVTRVVLAYGPDSSDAAHAVPHLVALWPPSSAASSSGTWSTSWRPSWPRRAVFEFVFDAPAQLGQPPAGVPSTHRPGSPARGDGGRRRLAETSPAGRPRTRRQGWRR